MVKEDTLKGMIKLYFHGGSENHGCEAIVRGTTKVLGNKPILFSLKKEQDEKYNLQDVCTIIDDKDSEISKYSIKNIIAILNLKLGKGIDLIIKNRKYNLLNNINKNDICLSIGGDNYCYKGTEILASLNRNILKKGSKTVLWGCSVEPSLIEGEIGDDLAKYSLIVARESISYEALKKVNSNTKLYPDSAFQLDKVELPLPHGFIENNTIGINLSPLIMECENNKGITRQNYISLIQHIIDTTDMQIALIPHVVWNNNDDRKPLNELYEYFKDTKRVIMIDDGNCMELKGYISRCRMFIGARTHATIAAYSTCVPTLVIGYSVKAKGIAKDIFGTYENYVLPVQSLKNENDLINAFEWLSENEENIRKYLEKFMPDYKMKALESKKEIEALLGA